MSHRYLRDRCGSALEKNRVEMDKQRGSGGGETGGHALRGSEEEREDEPSTPRPNGHFGCV